MKEKGDKSGFCRESQEYKDMTKSLPTQQEFWSKGDLSIQSEVGWEWEAFVGLAQSWAEEEVPRSNKECY